MPIQGIQQVFTLESSVPRASESHTKIFIVGNDALDAFPDKSGAGNASSPYIIQDFTIDAGGSGSAIMISSTNRTLVLASCTVTGSSHVGGQGGIRLFNCENVLVSNCTFSNNDADGIVVEACRNIMISFNQAINNTWDGIFIDDSINCSVVSNIARYNRDDGIEFRNSTHGSISHNKIYQSELQGINIAAGSDYNIVRNNTIEIAGEHGMLVDGNYNTISENNIIASSCIRNQGLSNDLSENYCLEPIPHPNAWQNVIWVVLFIFVFLVIVVACFSISRRVRTKKNATGTREDASIPALHTEERIPGASNEKPERPWQDAARAAPGDSTADDGPKLLRHKNG